MANLIVSKILIHIYLKSWQSVTFSNNQTCKKYGFCGIFNIDVKSVNALMRVLLIRFRLCKTTETF